MNKKTIYAMACSASLILVVAGCVGSSSVQTNLKELMAGRSGLDSKVVTINAFVLIDERAVTLAESCHSKRGLALIVSAGYQASENGNAFLGEVYYPLIRTKCRAKGTFTGTYRFRPNEIPSETFLLQKAENLQLVNESAISSN